MHDCHKTQEQLINLIFNELAEGHKSRLLSEIETCPECRDEHRSMHETLLAFDEASATILPDERYWPAYHRALQHRLSETSDAPAVALPFWQRLFKTSIRVPLPVAAVLLLLFTATALLALRSPKIMVVEAPAAPVAPATEKTRIVEVPVTQEKVVTHTVYVVKNRPSQQRAEAARSNSPAPASETKEGINSTHAALAGFKPADEVKLRIIKGNYQDEK